MTAFRMSQGGDRPVGRWGSALLAGRFPGVAGSMSADHPRDSGLPGPAALTVDSG
jgi:hypothetical protein